MTTYLLDINLLLVRRAGRSGAGHVARIRAGWNSSKRLMALSPNVNKERLDPVEAGTYAFINLVGA